MYTLKVIIAHPIKSQSIIIENAIKGQKRNIDIIAIVSDLENLYMSIIRCLPDLIILSDSYLTPCISVVSDKSDIICITENRSVYSLNNIKCLHVPVQAIDITNTFVSLYSNSDDDFLVKKYNARKDFIKSLSLPQTYCFAIDEYLFKFVKDGDMDLLKKNFYKEKNELIEKIKNQELQLTNTKEHHPGVKFDLKSTYNPNAIRLIDDIDNIVGNNIVKGVSSMDYKKASPLGISWIKTPRKLSYKKNEIFDISDGIVSINYDNGKTSAVNLNNSMIIGEKSSSVIGEKMIDVSVDGIIVRIPICIEADNELEDINLNDNKSIIGLILVSCSKKEYLAGEFFDISTCVIKSCYSNGSMEDVTNDCILSDIGKLPLKLGNIYIPVSYKGNSCIIPITVKDFESEKTGISKKKENSVESKVLPNIVDVELHSVSKTNYLQGEPFELNGISIKIKYSDGSNRIRNVATNMIKKIPDTNILGEQIVKIIYRNKWFVSFNINVCEKNLSDNNTEDFFNKSLGNKKIISIRFVRKPKKIEYIVGEFVDKNDLLIKADYSDNTSDILKDFEINPNRGLREDDSEVLIKAFDQELRYPITVLKKKIMFCVLQSQPNRVIYPEGTKEIDLTGALVKVCYSDKTIETIAVTHDMIEPVSFDKVGTYNLKVLYGSCENMYIGITIKPKEIVGISVIKNPNKTRYIAGELLDTTGMVLQIEYDNAEKEFIYDYKCENVVLKNGEVAIQLKYDANHSFPLFVSVVDNELIGIELVSLPDKVDYIERKDTLDVTGAAIAKCYSNGSKEVIPITLNMTNGFDNRFIGRCKVYVLYERFRESFDVNILKKEISSIEITRIPNKSIYSEGETIDLTGIVIKGHYNNNTVEDVLDYVIETKCLRLGDNEVVISYNGVKTSFPVTVTPRSVEAISVSNMPNKLSYKQDVEDFDASGGKVLIIYNNGTSDYVDMNRTVIDNFDNSVAGDCYVQISYEGCTTSFKVNVIPKTLLGISITNMPKNTVFKVGDFFTAEDMVITAFYDNGTTEVLKHYAVLPNSILTENMNSVVISYDDKTAILPIKVLNTDDYSHYINDMHNINKEDDCENLEQSDGMYDIFKSDTQTDNYKPLESNLSHNDESICKIPIIKKDSINYSGIHKDIEEGKFSNETIDGYKAENKLKTFYANSLNLRFKEENKKNTIFFI